MNHLRVCAPARPLFERSPELATLAILDSALLICRSALTAAHPDLALGVLADSSRRRLVLRATSIIAHSSRLAAALAEYRQALERDSRRSARDRARDMPF